MGRFAGGGPTVFRAGPSAGLTPSAPRTQTSSDGQDQAAYGFIPGLDGNLYWNTTVPVDRKPILLYLYDGHTTDDASAAFCQQVESTCFSDPRIVRLARQFTCEKICFGCPELMLTPKGREMISSYVAAFSKGEKSAHLVILAPDGEVIQDFGQPPSLAALARAMTGALKQIARQG